MENLCPRRRNDLATLVQGISVPVPKQRLGQVIGRGGRTISLLQELTGCELEVSQGTKGPAHILVQSNAGNSCALAIHLLRGVAEERIMYEDLEQLRNHCPGQSGCRSMTVASPLTPLECTSVNQKGRECWCWCPNCHRPLTVTEEHLPRESAHIPGETLPYNGGGRELGRELPEHKDCAYVAAIWGDDPGFVVGALVLGHALATKSSGNIQRVLLHTDDIGAAARECLQSLWQLELVDYVEVSDRCFLNGRRGRFAGTFNKLHALRLTRFKKVLLLDIDLVVLGDLTGLFDLPPPAALHRGANDKAHGAWLDGRAFFLPSGAKGPLEQDWSFGQGTGINAGVVLLEPNHWVHQHVLSEVTQDLHPEHIPTAAPEQDYLSRFYAPFWSHISVGYNLQIHQILYSLEKVLEWWADTPRPDWLPANLKMDVEKVKVIHFSGTLKLWNQAFLANGEPTETEEEFADRIFRETAWLGYDMWKLRTGSPENYARHHVALTMDEAGKRRFKPVGDRPSNADVEALIDSAVKRTQLICTKAVTRWNLDLASLLAVSTSLGPSLLELQKKLGRAVAPTASEFWPGQAVEIAWTGPEGGTTWWPGVVEKMHKDGKLDVRLALEDSHEIVWQVKDLDEVRERQTRRPHSGDAQCSTTSSEVPAPSVTTADKSPAPGRSGKKRKPVVAQKHGA